MCADTTPSERDLAAAAAKRKLLRQCPVIFDAALADIQNDNHPVVRLICWLGNQEISLAEQSLEVRRRIPAGAGETILRTAQAMRWDFSASLNRQSEAFLATLREFATNLLEIDADLAWIERNLRRACASIKAREAEHAKLRPVSGWLLNWPEEVKPNDLMRAISNGVLNRSRARRVQRAVAESLRAFLATASLEVLDEMRIAAAKAGKPHLPELHGTFEQRIGALMTGHPDWSNRRILGKYDDEEREAPARWRRHNHRDGTMLDALRCHKCQHPLESHLSRLRHKLNLRSRT
jgi:hypothetical protein